MQLPVNEIFETLQGEATHAGTPSIFVRLQGCAVGCSWCDTKYTWDLAASDEVGLDAVLDKRLPARAFARVDVDDLTNHLVDSVIYRARHIVITGGEPAMHDLTRLTSSLLALGRRVQIETSGTEPIRVAPGTWVTLSPKIDMPGGKIVQRASVQKADEIKMPVGKRADVETLKEFLALHRVAPHIPVWLQPLSASPKATALCVEAATANDWKISVQVHKFIGVR